MHRPVGGMPVRPFEPGDVDLAAGDDILRDGVETVKNLCSRFGITVNLKGKPSFPLVKEFKKALKRYPMLKHIKSDVWRHGKVQGMKEIVNYINLVDVCNQSSSTGE